MDITKFRTRLEELIAEGCSEISAGYVNSDAHSVIYKGCTVGSPAEQYLRLVIDDPDGYVFANYSNYPDLEFRVAKDKHEDEFSVRYIEKDTANQNIAVIRVM